MTEAQDAALKAAIEIKRRGLSRRYITALALVAFFTIAGYAGLRSVIVAQLDDAVTINISGRQRMLSQRIAFFSARYATARTAKERANSRRALEAARDLIETSHMALMEGDAQLGLAGLREKNSKAIAALYNEAPHAINRQMREFLFQVEELLATPVNQLSTDQLNLKAIEAAAEGPLLSALNTAVKHYEIESRERIDTLARIELVIVAITIITLLFEALFIFRPMVNALIREELHLRRSEEKLIAARLETDDILGSVNQGFFLLLPGHSPSDSPRPGQQYSRALLKILDREQISAKSMIELVQNPALPEERLNSMRSYLQMLFRREIRAETIEKLNPFLNFEYDTVHERRTLRFAFQRIYRGPQIRAVMVSVQDRTREIELTAELERNRATTQSRMERLFQVLQIEPARLRQFTRSLDTGLSTMKAVLARDESDLRPATLEAKLLELFRSAHTLKGEANLLQLEFMEQELHAFEHRIEQLKGTQLSGAAFLPVVSGIHSLHKQRAELEELLDRLLQFYTGWRPDSPSDDASDWLTDLLSDAEKLASSAGKAVRFDSQEFRLPSGALKARELLREIFVQLLRNAIAHGLESPDDRRAAGKAPEGLITIRTLTGSTEAGATSATNGKTRFIVRDDGRGLQFERIRERLLERATPDERAQIVGWSQDQLAEQIFEPGFSTRDAADTLGGRGIGMELVRARLHQHAGHIRVRSVTGHYTEFEIELCLNDRAGSQHS